MTTDRPLRYSISPLKRAAVAGLLALLAGLAFAAPAQYQTGMQERPNPKTMPIMMGFERTVNLGDLRNVQSSEKVKGTGAEISKTGFKIELWYPAVVPSSVLGTLVQNNVYRDISFTIQSSAILQWCTPSLLHPLSQACSSLRSRRLRSEWNIG